jgi:HK97 family phage prohead protease
MTSAAINDLPDSAFAYIEPGGTKDAQGKTVPRSKRHFPIHDRAHVANALSRAPQSPFGDRAMRKIKAAAKKFGVGTGANAADDAGEYRRAVPAMAIRAFDFEPTATGGDGRTLDGYAAVYNVRARIRAQGGDFDEEILPGAFARSLAKRTPVLQWEHGLDPRVGRVPIGAIADIGEDRKGLRVHATLFDNEVVEPIRQAIAGGAVRGMSFRFEVPSGGDQWSRRHGEVDLRRLADVDAPEVSPVVFPAYDATTVSVRSILAQFDPDERAALIRELAAEVRLAADLPDMDTQDLDGRSDAWSADGVDPDTEPGNGDASPPINSRQRLDDGALRVRGILHNA